jgi:glycerol-3-phosphate dehydrogenase (NAD(P)+)
VTLWGRSPELAARINETGANETYLPNLPLPDNITATANPADLAEAELVLIAVPAQAVRETLVGSPIIWRPASPRWCAPRASSAAATT